jgi:hypothetical protein
MNAFEPPHLYRAYNGLGIAQDAAVGGRRRRLSEPQRTVVRAPYHARARAANDNIAAACFDIKYKDGGIYRHIDHNKGEKYVGRSGCGSAAFRVERCRS